MASSSSLGPIRRQRASVSPAAAAGTASTSLDATSTAVGHHRNFPQRHPQNILPSRTVPSSASSNVSQPPHSTNSYPVLSNGSQQSHWRIRPSNTLHTTGRSSAPYRLSSDNSSGYPPQESQYISIISSELNHYSCHVPTSSNCSQSSPVLGHLSRSSSQSSSLNLGNMNNPAGDGGIACSQQYGRGGHVRQRSNTPVLYMNLHSSGHSGSCENVNNMQHDVDFLNDKTVNNVNDKGEFGFDFENTLNSSLNLSSGNNDLDVNFEQFSQPQFNTTDLLSSSDAYQHSTQESYHNPSQLISHNSYANPCQRPQSCPDVYLNLKFEQEIQNSLSPMSVSSHNSLQIDFDIGNAVQDQFNEQSPNDISDSSMQQCMNLLDQDPSNVLPSDITPDSGETTFDYIGNSEELNELASIVENYHKSGKVDIHSESSDNLRGNQKYFYGNSIHQQHNSTNVNNQTRDNNLRDKQHHQETSQNYLHEENPFSSVEFDSSNLDVHQNFLTSHDRTTTFTKPQPVSPGILSYTHSSSSQQDTGLRIASPLQCNQLPQIPKAEPVFTPPASPYEANKHLSFGCNPIMSGHQEINSSTTPPRCTKMDYERQLLSSHLNNNVAFMNTDNIRELELSNNCETTDIFSQGSHNLTPRKCVKVNGFSDIINNEVKNHMVKPEKVFQEMQQLKFVQTEVCFSKANRERDFSGLNPGIKQMSDQDTPNSEGKEPFVMQPKESPRQAVLPSRDSIPGVQDCLTAKVEKTRSRRHSNRGRRGANNSKSLRARDDVRDNTDFYEISSDIDSGHSNPISDATIPVMKIRRKSSLSESPTYSNSIGLKTDLYLDASGVQCTAESSRSQSSGNRFETIDPTCITDPMDESSLSSRHSRASKTPPGQQTVRPPRNINSCSTGAKICGVCGDVAKSMHFGGMACDSCKAFFRRSVQGRSWKDFKCSADRNCSISKKSRKNCQFCRFTKCRSNGMEVTWVMTEAERMALWKTRLSKHRKSSTSSSNGSFHSHRHGSSESEDAPNPDDMCCDSSDSAPSDKGATACSWSGKNTTIAEMDEGDEADKDDNAECSDVIADDILESIDVTKNDQDLDVAAGGVSSTSVKTFNPDYPLDEEDLLNINNLIALQEAVFQCNPYPKPCYGDSVDSLANIFVCICKKLGTFFYRVDDFYLLCKGDQMTLLRTGISMSIYFHGAYAFDVEKHCWPRRGCRESLLVPPVSSQTLLNFTGFPDAYNLVIDFYTTYGPDLNDEGVLAMLSLVAIFQVTGCHDNLQDKKTICELREKYIQLLGRYLQFRQGTTGMTVTLPKLLFGLEVTRKIAEFHSKVAIKPTMPASEMSVSCTTSSFSNQMFALRDAMKETMTDTLPAYSSVLGPTDDCKTITSSYKQSPKMSLHFHHPLTDVIFGSDNRTDILFGNALDHITQYKEKLLSISYEHESLHQYHNPGSVHSSGSCEQHDSSVCLSHEVPSSAKSDYSENEGQDSDSSKQGSSRKAISPFKSHREDVAPYPSALSIRDNKGWTTSLKKKKGIKVLCEMLEYISKCDDPEAIESLQKSLPPYVLKNLASKLNIN